MKNWLAIFAIILSACSTGSTAPPNDVLTWTMATQNEDGTALPLAQIKHTQINWGVSGGPYPGNQIVLAPATTVSIPRGPTPGTVCYVASTVTTDNRQSVPSNEACVTVLARPNPPTGLTAH